MLSKTEQRALRQTFFVESEEGLSAIEQALVALETQPGDSERVDEIFRVVHTLKGDAGTVGFEELSSFAHSVEDVLDRVRGRSMTVTSELVTLLLRSVDALRALVGSAARGEPVRIADRELRRELKAVGEAGGNATLTKRLAVGEPGVGATGKEHGSSPHRQATSLRVSVDRLDALLTTVGEISVARGQLTQLLEDPSTRLERAREVHLEAERLHFELQELAMKLRMVPVGPIFDEFRRAGRDLALRFGKRVRLELTGSEVEIDNSVLQLLKDPLTHIFRNAVDHGIETPAEREALGKDPTGVISLRAYHRSGRLVIECEDDGAGLDRERITERARQLGHLPAAEGRLTDADLLQLIARPGFSTAEVVTGLSGRGVGMDLVRRNVEAVRGSLSLESRRGKGTCVTLRVPLTLSIIEGLLVRVEAEAYVLALDSVVESVDLPADGRGPREDRGLVTVRGRSVPYVRLRSLFDLRGPPAGRENLIIVKRGRFEVGLVVDEVAAKVHAVIRPLAKLLQGVRGVSSSTILGDGTVALILDIETLLSEEATRGTEMAVTS